jgi:hypothetical protein
MGETGRELVADIRLLRESRGGEEKRGQQQQTAHEGLQVIASAGVAKRTLAVEPRGRG